MRILIVSFFFPPYNAIGSVRVGKTAKYLIAQGHEIRVVGAKDCPFPSTLELEIPESDVKYVQWVNVGLEVDFTKKSAASAAFNMKPGMVRSFLRVMARFYRNIANIPDGQIGWIPGAVKAGSATVEEWRPDLIFASAMPISSLLVGEKLSAKFNIPWVAELRDLWTDNHYNSYPWWRMPIEKRMEKRVLNSCSGMVTVSKPLADTLAKKYPAPVQVILNGYDEDDIAEGVVPTKGLPLRITYTGNLYQFRRDPSPLFEAISKDKSLADNLMLDFYGTDFAVLRQLIEKFQIDKCVQPHSAVSHKESLEIQQTADVLLLLLYNHPLEKGVLTGKLFEYIGSGRPVLCIGGANSEAARLIQERGLGVATDDPAEIAQQLKKWIAMKQDQGAVPANPPEGKQGLSRKEQVSELSKFLVGILSKTS
ncbi:MAG TPA: glycosyltransferase family 4 protein [Fimbriimonadaceae bacterium]|jgi:glycosyltransferase involved in cell wall biosynthesis